MARYVLKLDERGVQCLYDEREEELQRVEEELGLKSHSDAIKYLIQYLEKPIVIEVSDSSCTVTLTTS